MDDLKDVLSVNESPNCKSKAERIGAIQLEGVAIERDITTHLGRATARAAFEDQARAYLETGKFVTLKVTEDDATLEELYARRRINARALKMARDDYQAARGEYSREVCSKLSGRNRQHAQAIASALAVLVEAARAERDFRSGLEAKGISVSLPPAAFPFLGFDLEDANGGLAAGWIKSARQVGLIR